MSFSLCGINFLIPSITGFLFASWSCFFNIAFCRISELYKSSHTSDEPELSPSFLIWSSVCRILFCSCCLLFTSNPLMLGYTFFQNFSINLLVDNYYSKCNKVLTILKLLSVKRFYIYDCKHGQNNL